jgi:putative FmdB family regulatory protein
MPLYNFHCNTCNKTEEKIVDSYEDKTVPCECGAIAEREFPVDLHFVLKYDPKTDKVSWGAEGYAKTRRYEKYDEMAKHNLFDMGQKVKA